MSRSDATIVEPKVLDNLYPCYDRVGNKMQRIQVRYACGHFDQWYSLDLGKGWKPRTKKQIFEDELRITCPQAWKLCRKCSEVQV